MRTRPKISRNEWKTTEIGAFEVGNFAPFCCSGFIVVRNSGHEAPTYVPREAYDLNDRLLRNRSFHDTPTRTTDRTPTCHACDGAPPFAGSAIPQCNDPSWKREIDRLSHLRFTLDLA